jgi:hypothetical protein
MFAGAFKNVGKGREDTTAEKRAELEQRIVRYEDRIAALCVIAP